MGALALRSQVRISADVWLQTCGFASAAKLPGSQHPCALPTARCFYLQSPVPQSPGVTLGHHPLHAQHALLIFQRVHGRGGERCVPTPWCLLWDDTPLWHLHEFPKKPHEV